VKLRLPKDGALPPLIELIEALAETGVEWVTLHGRRVGQPYARPASWDALATVAESSPLPLCANGDIRSPEDMSLLLERRSFAGIMPARGVAQKPWLPLLISQRLSRAGTIEGIRASSVRENTLGARAAAPPRTYAETAERYHRYLEEHLPPEFWRTRARRFYAYFAANFQFGHELAAGSQSISSYEGIKARALERLERWDRPLPIPE
jgi:tRNA-dihydrouridine synthase